MTEKTELRERLAKDLFLTRTTDIRWEDQVAGDVKKSYREIVDITPGLIRQEIEKLEIHYNVETKLEMAKGAEAMRLSILSLLPPVQTPEGGVNEPPTP